MASKKQHELFNKRFYKLMDKLGATKPGKYSYQYTLNTKAGLLYLNVHEPEKSEVFSIYCLFEEPGRAKATIQAHELDRLNSYSGKWNYHEYESDGLIERLERNLNDFVTN